MELGLQGKHVLVTGGTRGIGRVTATALARAGARVVACHRADSEAAASLARELKELGDSHHVVKADVTAADDVATLMDICRRSLTRLDGIVNNVGVDGRAPLEDLSPGEWHRVLGANLTGHYLVTRAALPLMSSGASVVNLGASAALRGRPGGAHYGAAKAGVIGFSRSLAKELGARGIRVNVVAPGVIATGADDDISSAIRERIVAMTALGRLGTPTDVANAVLYLLSDLASYITGATLHVDGGM